MPLFIDDQQTDSSQESDPIRFFSNHQALYKRSCDFIQTAITQKLTLTKSDRVLCVIQKEFATISNASNKNNFTFIATDDATTCHILVIIERNSKTISLAHIDNGRDDIREMIDELKNVSNNCKEADYIFDMYIFGGFIDDKKYSEKLFQDFMKSCQKIQDKIQLQIACVYNVNNICKYNQNCPIIYGIAVNIKTCVISIANCQNYGPDLFLRHSKIMYSAAKGLSSIYDNENGFLRINPFRFSAPSYAKEILQLPDVEYLELTSTSPHCEPSNFVEISKKTLTFVMEKKHLIEHIFQNKPRLYYLTEANEWMLTNQGQIELDSY